LFGLPAQHLKVACHYLNPKIGCDNAIYCLSN
jgi:hypothetical protein